MENGEWRTLASQFSILHSPFSFLHSYLFTYVSTTSVSSPCIVGASVIV